MTITDLYTYPVKSLQGIRLTEAEVSDTGLPWDRHWMVVDARGRFVTQRQLPAMATLTTALTDRELVLSQGEERLRLPLRRRPLPSTPVQVWESELSAGDEGEAASRWLTARLGLFRGAPLRLVRFGPDQRRAVALDGAELGTSHTQFADGFPFLVAAGNSLERLNAALRLAGQDPVPMTRFRANIVIAGVPSPFAELGNARLTHRQCQIGLCKPCERCPVVTVDQRSGTRAQPKEPLRTLRQLDLLGDGRAYFGGNGVLLSGQGGIIRIGDPLCWSPSDSSDRFVR
ncbi:MOSC domain-containing protein [Ferrimonas gelatinilytica]|uniref:MOSC N-terminal beta barrel domain-containing protein n=1 Tax=Ferrimonas gelatinilytica TaxID=1255257 RepID=A0ABP9S8B3_9GAMM